MASEIVTNSGPVLGTVFGTLCGMFACLFGEWLMSGPHGQVCASLLAALRNKGGQQRNCRAAGRHQDSKVHDCFVRSRRSAGLMCHSRFEMHAAVGSASTCCLNILAATGVVAAEAEECQPKQQAQRLLSHSRTRDTQTEQEQEIPRARDPRREREREREREAQIVDLCFF